MHIVSGVSVLEAKRIVRTLDDTGFNSERSQMVELPQKGAPDRARNDRDKPTQSMRPSPAIPPKVQRTPPPPRTESFAFERTLMLLFLLAVLGLQLALLVRLDR